MTILQFPNYFQNVILKEIKVRLWQNACCQFPPALILTFQESACFNYPYGTEIVLSLWRGVWSDGARKEIIRTIIQI